VLVIIVGVAVPFVFIAVAAAPQRE